MYAMIGTWKMCYDGLTAGHALLSAGGAAADAVERAITMVEDNPAYSSVGYGGLPARDGHVLLDAGWMDGETLRYGGIMAAENLRNPIRAARLLCGRETNCLLAGRGAEQFAVSAGLPLRDMRTESAMARWRETAQTFRPGDPLTAYRGHDTVCVLALDGAGRLIAGTSTSGLFMKEPGRVGDSPIVGSGFYCDGRYGAAAATGLGEDVMRGCLSYEVVTLMRRGASPQSACEEALRGLSDRKLALGEDAGSISLIALSPAGETGAATTLNVFPFVAGTPDGVRLLAARQGDGCMDIRPATAEELEGEP